MKSNTETEQLDQEIEKWFEELETELNKPDVAKWHRLLYKNMI